MREGEGETGKSEIVNLSIEKLFREGEALFLENFNKEKLATFLQACKKYLQLNQRLRSELVESVYDKPEALSQVLALRMDQGIRLESLLERLYVRHRHKNMNLPNAKQ